MFVNNEVRGDSAVKGALVYVSGGEAGYWEPTGPVIEGGEISCRGSGAPAIKIDGDPTDSGTVGVIDVILDHVWNQDCGQGAPSSPYISIHNASHVTFRDMQFSTSLAVSPIFSITESAPGLTNFIVFDNDEVICQNLNCSGQMNWISDTTTGGYTHRLPPATINRQHYGYFTYIQYDVAANWPPQSVNTTQTSSTTTNQTDTNLTVTQSATAGSVSYKDAGSGYAWRVQNEGAIDLDFGANDYADSWIESYQNGTTIGKPLNINTKYGGYTNFGGDIFGPSFTFTNGTVTNETDTNLTVMQSGAVGSASYKDASTGHAWRVQNQGAINLDFGANDYASSWIESYQNGTATGKPLSINTKYGGYTYFGGTVFAPDFVLNNGYGVPAMPSTSAAKNHVACILSAGPPIVLGHCTTSIGSDGSCNCM